MGRRKGKRGGGKGTWAERRRVARVGAEKSGYTQFIVTNENFEAYYSKQRNLSEFFDSKDQWGVFMETLRQKLPVTFRINPISQDNELLKKIFKETALVSKIMETSVEVNNKQKKDKTKKEDQQTKKKIEETDKTSSKTEEVDPSLEESKQEKELVGRASDLVDCSELEREISKEITKDSLELKQIPWYPNELTFQLNVNKYDLKGSSELASLHKYITKCSEAGLITRQELVSMLPPLFLSPQHSDLVFDACAAPGSKTTQLVEMLRLDARKKGIDIPTGGIVANDAEFTRAYMLSHQIKRLCIPEIMIVNHMAQFFPTIFMNPVPVEKASDNRIFFDKILVDAPCSGDAAIRKIPELWTKWRTSNGIALHKVQLKILLRSLHMLKEGGTLVYSTCSLNPVENEAVVAAAFRSLPEESIEVLDIHGLLPNLVSRRGMTKWTVADEKEEEERDRMAEESKEKMGEENNRPKRVLVFHEEFNPSESKSSSLERSMFPDDETRMRSIVKIQNTMRILPHDQNTGGFYIALIKKHKPTRKFRDLSEIASRKSKPEAQEESKEDLLEEKEHEDPSSKSPKILLGMDEEEPKIQRNPEEDEKKPVSGGRTITKERANFVRFDSNPEWPAIREKYGIGPDFDSSLLYTLKGIEKKVILTTPKLAQLIESDKSKNSLFFINLGTKIFDNNRQSAAEGVGYRICQDGARYLLPFMTKRKILVSNEQFEYLMSVGNVKIEDIPWEYIRNELGILNVGSIVFYTATPDHTGSIRNCATFIRFKASIVNMVGKEVLSWLKITMEAQKA